MNEFEKTYSLLEDQKSKNVFVNMLNYRITREEKYLEGIVDNEKLEYFDESLFEIRNKTFVDCGAYIGDTVEKFLSIVKKEYKKIICLEPDPNIYKELIKNIKKRNQKNIECFNLAAYKEKSELYFEIGTTGEEMSNHISENGTVLIFADTLDHIITEKVDLIKMDIEGAEYEALLGCKALIKRDRPVLIICIYHKKDDYIRILNLMQSLCENYKFMIRQYAYADAETVCYAIPK